MFAVVRQIQPGHYVELQLDQPSRIVQRRYWELRADPVHSLSLDEAAQPSRALPGQRAPRLTQRRAVGAAFSGGVDSSANVTAMRALSGPELDLHTFSYVADDPAVSEEQRTQPSRETSVWRTPSMRAPGSARGPRPADRRGRALRGDEHLCAVPSLPARTRGRCQGNARRPRRGRAFRRLHVLPPGPRRGPPRERPPPDHLPAPVRALGPAGRESGRGRRERPA